MSQRAIRKQQQKLLANYTPSAYSKSLNKYLRNTAKIVDPLLKSIAYHCPFASILPAYHSLRAASRLFLLSELQTLLTAFALEITRWDIYCPSMMEGTSEMGELFRFPCQSQLERRVGLLMMVASYWAKTVLNEDCVSQLDQATKICPSLSLTVQQWLLQHPSLRRIAIRQINHIYSFHQRSRLPNYNYLVDQIITLSHSYAENQSNPSKRSQDLNDFEVCHSHKRPPRKLIKFDLDFVPPELVNYKQETIGDGLQCRISSLSIFGHTKTGESQLKGLLEASDKINLPFPNIFQGVRQNQNEYFQVGLYEGESELMVFGEAFSSIFLARKGWSQASDAKQLP